MTENGLTNASALKGCLFQLDETLRNVLEGVSSNVTAVSKVLEKNNELSRSANENVYSIAVKLKEQELLRFDELKSEIIRTATEITDECKAYTDTRDNAIISSVEGTYVAQSEFGTYRSETASTLSVLQDGITANAGATEEVTTDLFEYKTEVADRLTGLRSDFSESIADVLNEYESFRKSTQAELSVMPSAIKTSVSEDFISKTELGGSESLEAFVGSRVTQTASSITDEFNNKLSVVSDEIGAVNNGVNEYITETNAYIRRGELETGVYGIEIGRSDSNIKTRFLNNRISFYQGSVEVAYISDNNLYILRAEILDYLRIGNSTDGYFIFDVSQNGLEVRWSN